MTCRLQAFNWAAPLLLMLLMAAFLFWPLLVGRHLVPFHTFAGDPFLEGLDTASDRPDWRTYDQTPVTLSYTEKHLFAARLRQGEIALWNPFNGLGYPLIADGLCQPLAPLFLPFMAWPTPWVFSCVLVLNLMFGGLGMDRFLKALGAGTWSRCVAAALFAFNPYTLKYAAYSNVWAYAWFPWVFAAAEALAVGRAGPVWLAAAITGMGMSGHPEETLMGAVAALVYAMVRSGQERGWTSLWRRPSWASVPALALGFSVWWVWPMLEWVSLSWSPRIGQHLRVSYAPDALFTLGSELLWLPPLLLLALLGLRKQKVFAGLLPCLLWPLVLLFPWPAGLQRVFDLGFMSGRYTRSLAWFALPVLVSLGLEAWASSSLRRWERWAGLAVLAAWCSSAIVFAVSPSPLQGELLVPLWGIPAATSIAVWGIVVLGAMLFLLPVKVKSQGTRVVRLGLAACVLGGALLAPPGMWAYWNRSAPLLSQQARGVLEGRGRLWFPHRGLWQCVSPNLATLFEVRDIRSVSPLAPRRLVPLVGALGNVFYGFLDWSPEVMEFAGVEKAWRWAHAPQDTRVVETRLVSLEGRAFWVPVGQSAATAQEALHSALEDRAWTRVVLLEGGGKPQEKEMTGDTGSGGFSAKVSPLLDVCNRSSWRVEAPSAGWLVLRDLYWPGWKASVDGLAVQVLAGDGVFRAVAVPEGTHCVTFSYRPRSVIWGGFLSLASALCSFAWGFGRRRLDFGERRA